MTTIYLDSSALGIATSGPEGAFHVQPELPRMVAHLLDAGHTVMLAGDAPDLADVRAALPADVAGRVQVHPGRIADLGLDATGWLVTSSTETCEALHEHRRLRSILVGSASGSAGQVDRPADVVARSLTDAVLGILTEDAMASG